MVADGKLGEGVSLPRGCAISRGTTIGRYTRINGPAVFRGIYPIEIGQFCAIGRYVLVISHNHRTTFANLQLDLHESLHPGQSAKGVPRRSTCRDREQRVDRRPRHDPNGYIDRRWGSHRSAGGRYPADPRIRHRRGSATRVVKMRFKPEMSAFLKSVAWWDWPMDRIRRTARFLGAELSDLSVEEASALIVD